MAILTTSGTPIITNGGGYAPGYAPGCGSGFGGDGLSALLVAAMLGGGGFGGFGRGVADAAVATNVVGQRCATTDDLNAQTLGDIKASVPLAEAQVQLALQGLQSYLSTQNTANANAAAQGQTAILLGQLQQGASLTAAITGVDNNVSHQACEIRSAICEDGNATRALITTNLIAELNQKLTVAQQEALELRQRNDRDRDRHGVEITMNNNQNQLQQQQQLQFQAINHQIAGLCGLINQSNRATNSTVQVGNTGAATAGPQNNNPTNVVA